MNLENRLRKVEGSTASLVAVRNAELDEECKLLEENLYMFAEHAWPYVCKNESFVPGWHIDAIGQHLECVFDGTIQNIVINIPPRCTKSTFLNIIFPAWVWANTPVYKFTNLSYSSKLCLRDSRLFKQLIESSWYQARWGHKVRFATRSLSRLINISGGERMISSIKGSNTGEGADFIICFPYDTLVLTDIGPRAIGWIVDSQLPYKILSYNHETNETEYKEIEAFERNPGKRLIEIELEDGEKITCTEEHPFYTKNGYIPACNLAVNDELYMHTS